MNRYMRNRLMRGTERRDMERGRKSGRFYMDKYPDRRSDYEDEEPDYERGGRGYEQPRKSYRSNRDYAREVGYEDYEDYPDFEYNYDMQDHSTELKTEDIHKWQSRVKNADGTRGAKFSRDQIMPIAKQLGIDFSKFTEEEFLMTVNMMYSDYCMALRDSAFPNYMKPEPYVHMAKAFLCDKDFNGKPYEKLAIYYYEIADYEE